MRAEMDLYAALHRLDARLPADALDQRQFLDHARPQPLEHGFGLAGRQSRELQTFGLVQVVILEAGISAVFLISRDGALIGIEKLL